MTYTYSFPMLSGGSFFSLLPVTYPLDLVSGATGAWGYRLLSSTYTGPLLQIRRSSDDTTLDIGAVGPMLDFASLEAFVGLSDGRIAKLYDQTGNGRDQVQATLTTQPRLISAGSYYPLIGNYPAGDYDTSHVLESTGFDMSTFITTSAGTVCALWAADAGGTGTAPAGRGVWCHLGGNSGLTVHSGSDLDARAYLFTFVFITAQQSSLALNTPYVTAWHHTGGTLKVYNNADTAGDSQSAGTSAGLTARMQIGLPGQGTGGGNFDGRIGDVITYNTGLSTTDLHTIGDAMLTPYGGTWAA